MSDGEFMEKLEAARSRTSRMDREDRRIGFATPCDAGPLQAVRCAESALTAGLKMGDEECLFEALIYLEGVRKMMAG